MGYSPWGHKRVSHDSVTNRSLRVCFPGSSVGKESTYNAEDPGLIPGWGRPLEKEMATFSSILV